MKFSTVLLVAGAAVVAAQSLADLPTCAKTCAGEKLIGTSCGADPKCICTDTTFLTGIAACVTEACTGAGDLDATIKAAVQICNAVNISLDTDILPPATTSTSTTSSTDATVTDAPTDTAAPSTIPTGSAGGKNDTISTPKPGSDDEDEDGGSDSAAGRVGGSIIGVVAALAGACLLL